MTTCRALLADVFAAEPLAGSVTGVVPDWTGPDGQRGDITDELGAPTAFLCPDDDAHRRLRVEAPEGREASVERGALAAYGALAASEGLSDGTYAVDAEGERREVEVDDGDVWVDGAMPSAEPTDIEDGAVAAALGIGAEALLPSLPHLVAGDRLIVGVQYLADLRELQPDEGAITALDADVERVVAVTFETLGAETHLYARAIGAGGVGTVEAADARAVASALESAAAFDGEFPTELRCETGHVAGRPGEVRVDEAGRVGGRVAVSLAGTLALPEASDDDILVA